MVRIFFVIVARLFGRTEPGPFQPRQTNGCSSQREILEATHSTKGFGVSGANIAEISLRRPGTTTRCPR